VKPTLVQNGTVDNLIFYNVLTVKTSIIASSLVQIKSSVNLSTIPDGEVYVFGTKAVIIVFFVTF